MRIDRRKVVAVIKRHWANLRTSFTHRITRAGAEAMNAKIQAAQRRACESRNPERFRTAIHFHCGGLDLDPACTWSGT